MKNCLKIGQEGKIHLKRKLIINGVSRSIENIECEISCFYHRNIAYFSEERIFTLNCAES